jgi:uncharacterized protein
MDLSNEFTVPVPVERAWEVLTDVELIAPCLPGAQLQEVEGDEYRGTVKVKVGPITAQYKGAAVFQEQDVENHRVVLKAEGRDTRGQGSASAIITAVMTESGEGSAISTHVTLDSDVTIKGKVAQFGRGMIADVSAKLLTEFVDCIEGKLLARSGTEAGSPVLSGPSTDPDGAETMSEEPAPQPAAAPPAGDEVSRVRKVEQAETRPVDLVGVAGAPLAKRVVPVVVVVLLLVFVRRRRAASRAG